MYILYICVVFSKALALVTRDRSHWTEKEICLGRQVTWPKTLLVSIKKIKKNFFLQSMVCGSKWCLLCNHMGWCKINTTIMYPFKTFLDVMPCRNVFQDQIFMLLSVPHAQNGGGFATETCSEGACSPLLECSTKDETISWWAYSRGYY